ncbi:ATP-binding cassette domain-containing protein [Agrobacterium vitis]|uniref:ABC transporter ATP-binding protein n=1 Tax=Agrobacterium vitis TaxID=373 RepID=A0AAE4WZS8_AGRVI|nr:ABC transporter ATP-binding protein [Agrobacterium vitis]MBF2714111.1 ABC transporter ATP-binding protein [Agrobacterium vitis]MUO81490.1 ATP-binding cassette domain-containing protein [Agrobacterium vitis]MUO95863.1 ATP-binding cassette domain-containing protein [Agrobacterium vitis]MVA93942.1 ATP-binding cassette domain-containing protein [Agrobacterium vitis]MVB03551.1 ATP-binding cassette domain-containing protein [Agrobacterium vitis]
MPILELNGVSKSFGALVVAENIGFAVEQGEALGVIGPNGAGKSTLFNLINGNLPVASGSISFDGRDVTHMPPMQRCLAGMGRTFQIPQPFERLSVYENLLVAGAFGTQTAERHVADACADILVETGLIGKANMPAGSLTLLERKRLELARALATQPKLLLLDEIAGGLTEGECHQLVATIKRVHQRGMTIIWIEHVLHALTAVAERILVLNFGRAIGIGAPDTIMASNEVREIYLGMEA